jgi:HAD superfamily hydrolase (TIGR01549 family)
MKYTHIIFDIDGTLIDTETAALTSLQDTIFELQHQKIEIEDLRYTFGIPSEVTLRELGVGDIQAGCRTWNDNMKKYFRTISVFDGIETLVKELKAQHYHLGIITSKTRKEYENDFLPFALGDFFETVITVEDALHPKPSPDPILKYLEIADAKKEEVLYVGDSIYDMQCALDADVDFGLARWGCHSVRHIYATHYFNSPQDISYLLGKNNDPFADIPWLRWAMELQFIAQAGITYSKDTFDIERFERLREIAAEIMTHKSGMTMEHVRSIFCNEEGFQTPKLDTRAAIFQDGKILLVRETNGTWSLPGGWVDVNQSIKANTVKEVKEEAGLDVVPVRLIALQDRNMHNVPLYAYGICKAFVLCEIVGGTFVSNNETTHSGYFALGELPPLALEKNTEAQIKLCFDAYHSGSSWQVVFD